MQNLPGGNPQPRSPADIMADATLPSSVRYRHGRGDFFIDDEVLKQAGVSDFAKYAVAPGSRQLLPDLFL